MWWRSRWRNWLRSTISPSIRAGRSKPRCGRSRHTSRRRRAGSCSSSASSTGERRGRSGSAVRAHTGSPGNAARACAPATTTCTSVRALGRSPRDHGGVRSRPAVVLQGPGADPGRDTRVGARPRSSSPARPPLPNSNASSVRSSTRSGSPIPTSRRPRRRGRDLWSTGNDDGTRTLHVRLTSDAYQTVMAAVDAAVEQLPELTDDPDHPGVPGGPTRSPQSPVSTSLPARNAHR